MVRRADGLHGNSRRVHLQVVGRDVIRSRKWSGPALPDSSDFAYPSAVLRAKVIWIGSHCSGDKDEWLSRRPKKFAYLLWGLEQVAQAYSNQRRKTERIDEYEVIDDAEKIFIPAASTG